MLSSARVNVFSKVFSLVLCLAFVVPGVSLAAKSPWVMAYYPFWVQKSGMPSVGEINFSCMTHIVHFAVLPTNDGTIDMSSNGGVTSEAARSLIQAAHAAGKKALISIGGANSRPAFLGALSAASRPTFVKSVVKLCVDFGYDGVDLDMEPIKSGDVEDFAAFAHSLRESMKAANPRLLLTAATQWEPKLFGRIQGDLDQVNLMTYDLAGKWLGKSWHNSAIRDGSKAFTSAMPVSIDGMVKQFAEAGIPRTKLGAGIDFMGYIWTGVHSPNQDLKTAVQSLSGSKTDVNAAAEMPAASEAEKVSCSGIKYNVIMDQHYKPEYLKWDNAAGAAYLSIDLPGTDNDKFISFDSERGCAEKAAYVKQQNLGGLIIWDIGAGYRPNQPAGKKDALLKSVGKAVFGSARSEISGRQ